MADETFSKKLVSAYMKLSFRGRYVFAIDLISLFFAVYLGYALRLTFIFDAAYRKNFFYTALVFLFCVLFSLVLGGIYRVLWTKASIEEYTLLFRWYVFGIAFFLLIYKLSVFFNIPRSSLIILVILGLMFLTASRAFWKLSYVTRNRASGFEKNVLIVGAGEAGTMIARDIARNNNGMYPIGFIDDNPNLAGMTVASMKVLGTSGDINKVVLSKDVELALIAIPSATGMQIKKFINIFNRLGVPVRVLPGLTELADGSISVSRLRSVNMEDLLRRDPVELHNPRIKTVIKDKTVLVTGAGGSIGSEVCRQILAQNPKELVILGHGEQSIYLLLESLEESGNTIPVRPVIADIAGALSMTDVFRKYSPQIVVHAAAHKHVPLMEENPREALRVNAAGTWNLADIAGKYGVERMVMISTDKAVNPTSVMGATKFIAERLLFSAQQKYPGTMYMAVRFGNVLGSRGSVIPKFEQQIARGGPITITHKKMRRYFMLIPEAVSLVLQAGAMGRGGELYVLDMGEQVNITEMAETLIRLHGREPYKDIQIKFTGIRPGEKLYEELFYNPAHVIKTEHSKIFLSDLKQDNQSILPKVEELLGLAVDNNMSFAEIKARILELAS